MFRISKRIFSKDKAPLLGRWSAVINKNTDLDLLIDWANHDHCGSELCIIPEREKRLKEIEAREKQIKNFMN